MQDHGVDQTGGIAKFAHSTQTLTPVLMRARLIAQAQSYSDAFLVLGILTCTAAPVALMLKTGRPQTADRPPVEMG